MEWNYVPSHSQLRFVGLFVENEFFDASLGSANVPRKDRRRRSIKGRIPLSGGREACRRQHDSQKGTGTGTRLPSSDFPNAGMSRFK